MPTYDYECADCGHRFEEFQSIKARPLKKCPSCGEKALQRLIGTGAGILFRGSGFYETDYKRVGDDRMRDREGKTTDKEKKPAKQETGGASTNGKAKTGAES